MTELQGDPALARGLVRDEEADERCPAEIEPIAPRIEFRAQLLRGVARRDVDLHLFHHERRATPHHLHRLGQALPLDRRAEDIVAIDHGLQRRQVRVHSPATVEGQERAQYIRVTLLGQQMMKEDALLQGRQGINVLHVPRAAGYLDHDPLISSAFNRTSVNISGVIPSTPSLGIPFAGTSTLSRSPPTDDASADNVGIVKRLLTLVWSPSRRMRSIKLTAKSECPPNSKKLS